MIAITGACGKLGKLVLEELLNENIAANKIVALTRSTQKLDNFKKKGITVRYGNYDEPESLDLALKGVSKLLLISSSEIGKRVPQHKAVIDSAKRNNVELIAYTSILKADKSPLFLAQEHLETENLIKESGLPYVFLRNGWYTENYTDNASVALEMGTLFGCAKGGRFSTAPRKDYASAAAKIISGSSHEGKIYELAGDESFTLSEFALILSKFFNKSIKYKNLDEKSYAEALAEAGLPKEFAEVLADSEAKAADGWLYDDGKQLSTLLGRQTTATQEMLD
jgi:NAD(P)H dehydrogenase (quinone)